MTSGTTTTKLICAECRHENEAERIFCHNCGERLDRSPVAAHTNVEDPREAHRRLRKMLQGPSQTRRNFFVACKLILGAAATAGLLQMILPPDFPAPAKASLPVQLDLELEKASSHPAVLELSQQDVNAYLMSRLSSKKKVLTKPFLDWERAAVVFKDGFCVVGWERSIFGYPIYSQAAYRVDINAGKIVATNNGAWIGRLPVHPALMPYANVVFADLWSALDRERKLVSKMQSVEFHDGTVTFTSAAH